VSVVKKKLTREINVNKKFFDLNFRINKWNQKTQVI
jgi:hypothetical protein